MSGMPLIHPYILLQSISSHTSCRAEYSTTCSGVPSYVIDFGMARWI